MIKRASYNYILSYLILAMLASCGGGGQKGVDDFLGGDESNQANASLIFSSKSFEENLLNDGSFNSTISVTLDGRLFIGTVGEDLIGAKASVSNLPTGLILQAVYVSETQVDLTLSGSALSHANSDDVSNLTIEFLDSAFNNAEDIAGNPSNLIIDFKDPYTLSYNKDILAEAGDNDGTVDETFIISFPEAYFNGTVGEDFIGNSKLVVTNVPSGLTADARLTGTRQVTFRLIGSALSHANSDDITNLTISFQNSAFPGGITAAGVAISTRSDLSIDFFDPAIVSYVGGSLQESVANTGAIGNQLTINVVNDTFTGNNGDNYILQGKAAVTNVPAGLTAVVTKVSDTDLALSLTGNATTHLDANDVSNLTIQLNSTAFDFNTNSSNVTGSNKNDIAVDFLDPYTLNYSTRIYNESGDNDGSIGNVSIATVSGTTFSGSNGDDLFALGKLTFSNLPAGIIPVATKVSNTQVNISLTGNATSHEAINSITDLGVSFQDNAFSSGAAAGITNASVSDFQVNYLDPVNLSYSGSVFSESSSNDGSISNYLDITVSNDTFTGTNGENFLGSGKVALTPGVVTAGLSAVVEKISNTVVRFRLLGNATLHNVDISGIQLVFSATAFTNSTSTSLIANSTKSDISLDFYDQISFSRTSFNERAANDGAISETSVITLEGIQFTGSNGDNFNGTSKVTIANVPTGLSAVLTRDSDYQATLSFSGVALNHAVVDDISNIVVSFNDSAFTSANAAKVANSTVSNIEINYLDPVTVSYSTSTFNESVANDGSIGNTIDLTLTGDTFSGTNGDVLIGLGRASFTPSAPTGLTVSLIRTSSTTLELRLTGNASVHEIDLGPFALDLNASAFTVNTNTTNIVGANKNDIRINYNDALSYSTKAFVERAQNDGLVDTSSIVTLTGVTFTGTNGDDFVANGKVLLTNVPVGLTASMIRNSSTQLTFTFTGTPASHTSADNISNINVVFQDSAFSHGDAGSVAGSAVNDVTISYLDPVTVSYSSDTFLESVANDGSISNNIVLTLTNDTFTGSNGQDFVGLGHVSISNLPSGLTATMVRNSATQLTFSLSGNASSNDLDVSNLQATFNASAFATTTDTSNVTNATKSDLKINYYDLLSYGSKTFTERALNDGQVVQTTTLNLTGAVFGGNNGDDFVSLGRVNVSNIPAGLSVVLTRVSATQLTMSFSGTASAHESVDSVSNLTIGFLDTAFSGASSVGIENSSVSDIAVNFFDSVALAYNTDTLSEALTNDGSIANNITITLVNDTFTGSNGENYLLNSKASLSNLPAGLSATLLKTNSTTLTLSLSGNAVDHGDVHDISNLSLTINASALSIITDTTNVLNATKSDLKIDYISPSSLVYDTDTLTESSANNGLVSSVINIDISGLENYTGSNGDNFIAQGKVTVSNVPTGLTAVVEKTAAKQVRLTLTGSASSHDSADSISNLRVNFNSTAFVYNNDINLVTNFDKSDINVTFFDTAILSYSAGSFSEDNENVGEVSQSIDIDLSNDTFGGTNGENFLSSGKATISNTPSGLVPRIEKISSTKVRVTFSGSAFSHSNADDISNLTIAFQASAFSFNTDVSTITNGVKNDLIVDFLDPYSLTYSGGTFSETSANTGASSDSLTVTLSGTTFTGANGDNFITSSKVIASNVPGGMTPVFTKVSDTQLTVTLSGNASVHSSANDISNLTFAFQNTAFTSNAAAGVVGANKNDVIVDFIDPYSISYSSETFNEAVGNIGQIDNSLLITLANHQFSGVDGDDFLVGGKISVSNVPSGLTATVIRNSSTELEVSLTGAATSHANSHDISNLRLTLQDSALTSGALAADVIGYDNSSIEVDFIAPYTLSANGFAFDEAAANDGSIDDVIRYTLVGTTFTGANGRDLALAGDVTIGNLPAGLTAVVTKVDDNNVDFRFTGTALDHAVADDISNLSIGFEDSAFTSGIAVGVSPNSFSAITISYADPPTLSYSPTTFNESVSNIGASSSTISIFAANKTYNGVASEDFVASSKVTVTGHPAGTTPVVTYISGNQLDFTLTGTASNHADANDIVNGITVTFNNSAFVGGNAAQVSNSTFFNISFDFEDPYQLSYGSTLFTESSLNDGSITTNLSLSLVGTLFNGANSEDFVATGKASVSNLPAGLTAEIVRLSSNLVQMSLTGNASAHADLNDISNLSVTFADNAFTSGAAAGVLNSTRSDLSIDFFDPASLAYGSVTFSESIANIGQSGTTIDVTLTNDTFTGPNGENYIATGKISSLNVPSGMTPSAVKISDTVVRLSLTGAASSHSDSDDVSNLGFTFQSGAFSFNSDASTINDYDRSNLVVNFNDPYTLSYSGLVFTESAANNGSIGNSIVLTLAGTTFTSTATDFVTEGKVSFLNLPVGLSAQVVRDSATQLTLLLSGNASSHLNSNDISNVNISFANSAFTSGAAAGVTDSSLTDLAVDFNDPPSISYASSNFSEAVSNTGSISTTIDVNLTNENFSGVDGSFYTSGVELTFTNTPAGLTARAQKISDNTVRLSFSGSAAAHTSIDSISDFTVQFNDSAFTNVAAGDIQNSSKSDFNINFINPYSISFASGSFSESVGNIGAINTTIDVSVVGTTFTGADSSFYTPSTEVTFTNTPAGLTARAQKISDSIVRISFSGNASAHANADDISSFGVTFNNAAFASGAAAGVNNNSKLDFIIDYIDPYTISYSAGIFTESSSNDGSIVTVIDVDLLGTSFTGSNGDYYSLGSEVTFTNTPSGLTPRAQKISNSKVRLSFSGSASSHVNGDDISNFSVQFNNLAFASGATAGVSDSGKSDFVIDFKDAAVLSYSSSTFSEAIANTGSIDNVITVTIGNDVFTGSNGENYVATGKVLISNLPSGLTASMTKTSSTTADFSLSGSSTSHINSDDIANLTVAFQGSAFDFNTDETSVSGYNKSDFIVDYLDPYTLAYSTDTYSEAAANDGSVGNSIVITLAGTSFTSTGSDFISEGKLAVTNVPAGLSAVAVRDSATQMTLSLSGNATNNLNANDVSNLTVSFSDTAFNSGAAAGVQDSGRNDLIIDFEDQPSISYAASTFNESISNTGVIGTTIDVSLTGATFTGADSSFYTTEVTFINTPAGLTASAQKIDANTVRLSFTGSATNHATSDNISNFAVQFNNTAFNAVLASNVSNSVKSDFNVNFINPYFISYSGGVFTESSANVGGVSDLVDITLSGTTYTGVNGSFYSAGSEFSVTNVPSGLTAVVQKISDTVIRVSFSGAASAHANADDISNLGIQLNDAAFSSGASAGVTNSSKADFAVDFIDPYSLSFSDGTFVESSANDGSINQTIDLDLAGTTFTGANGAFYTSGLEVTFTNTPAGLTVRAQKISNSKLRISFSGMALSHDDVNDVANFGIQLNNSAFSSNASAGVSGSTKLDYVIDFRDSAALAFDSGTFNEANSNIGEIGNVINITITNDTFTGSNGENFIGTGKASVANVPAGLTASLNKVSDTSLQFILSGSASTHTDAEDISNLRITFSDTAFTFNTDETSVANFDRSDLLVDFNNPYLLSYSTSTFTEATANDGSIGNSIVLTLSGTTFTTTGSDYITEGKIVISNVPAGLSASVSRDSATQLTLSLVGAATNNLNANDISNLAVALQDSAFNSNAAAGVSNATKADIAVDFNDQPSLSFSAFTLQEASANTGSIAGQIDISISGETFSGSNLDIYNGTKVSFNNVPTGLATQVQKINDTLLRLTYTGNATAHGSINNISNIEVNFLDGAFSSVAASNVSSSSRTDLGITFREPYILSYSGGTFTESVNNDGSIGSTIDVDLSGTTFTGANGAIYSNGVEVTMVNAPAGLTARAQKIDNDTVRLSFTGNASDHDNLDDISNFGITFNNAAFTSGSAAGVQNTSKLDFVIDFQAPASLSYGAVAFSESNLNGGAISNQINIDIVNDTFTGAISSDLFANGNITINNVPAGLTASATKISATRVAIGLSGNATNHANVNDISNLEITFLASAFTNNTTASNVGGYTRSDIVVDFEDPYVLSYSTSTFSEASANDGSIANTILINLTGTSFTGSNSDDFSGSKALVSNVPAGLTATVVRNNANQVELSLTGTASSHTTADDIANLTISFQDSAFASGAAVGVDFANKSNIIVDFRDPAAIAYDSSTFVEGTANTGVISTTINVTLSNDTFTGGNGDNFAANGKATVSNVPAGLTAVLQRTSNTTMTLNLIGTASSHLNGNDISNLSVIFSATAFDFNSNASLVTNSSKVDFVVDFNDPYSLSYSSSTMNESAANDGSVDTVIDIDLTGTTFTGVNGDNFAGTKATVSNVPSGLSAIVSRTSATQVQLSLSGNATNHESSFDISNLTIIFQDTAFSSGAASGVSNFSKSDIAIDFNDRPVLSYNTSVFNEDSANTGGIGNSVVISLVGDVFALGTFDASKVTTSNLPAGLNASFTRDNDTQITMSLSGTAGSHTNADDILNVGINFLDTAFQNVAASNITNSSRSDLAINFLDPYQILYGAGTFAEALANDGTIGNSITISLSGTTFTTPSVDMIADGDVTITNVPLGLTPVITRDSGTQVTFSLNGTATAHANANDIINLEIVFNDSAFTSGAAAGVLNSTKSNFNVDFQDPASIAFSSATLSEANSNDGQISNTLDLDLSGDTFTGSVSDNFVGTKATVTNVPAGLTAVLTKIDANKLRLSLTGAAASHANIDDVANLTVTLLDNAFTNNSSASNVINYSRSDLGIDFQDPALISYSGSNFTEAVANNGTISNSLTLTLTGDTFTGSNGEDYVATSKIAVTNVPAGLTAVATKASNTTVTLLLTGSAASHLNSDDVSNLTVSFNNTAFSNNSSASNVSGALRNNLVIDYQDPATLSYSSSSFVEDASNNGVTSTSIVITLSGDTFTGVNSDDFVSDSKVTVSNIPAGLTAAILRNSATQVTMALTGNASSHVNADDISNLRVEFENSAFTNNSAAANIVNYDRSDLIVDFNDPAIIAYGANLFVEGVPNDGAISTSITITLSGDSFTGTNGENFVSNSKVSVANVPSGLTAVVTRNSATQVTASFTGFASPHADLNDVGDFTITFNANAFAGNTVNTNVVNYEKTDFGIDFNDPYAITYSSTGFIEAPADDDGSMDQPLVVGLAGTEFTGTNGDDLVALGKVTITNVPAGLTARMIRTSGVAANFFLDGNATVHNDAADISNLTVVFDDSAFAMNNASLVADASKNDLEIDFFVTPVNAPSDLLIADTNGSSITLSWTDNANNEARFVVERCDGVACDTTFTVADSQTIGIPDTTSYIYTNGISEGNYYKFRVLAENDDVSSAFASSELTIAFSGGTITDNGEGTSQEFRDMNCWGVTGTYAVMTWNDIGANNYLIYRDTGGGETLVETLASGVTSFVIDSLDLNSAESYRVVASMGTGVLSQNTTSTDFTTSPDFVPCNVIGNSAGTFHATGPTSMWDPQGVFIYDGKVYVADTNNYRVLIYNSIPLSKDAKPDVVLGQNRIFDEFFNTIGITNLYSNNGDPYVFVNSDAHANELRCPQGLWVGDVGGQTKIAVADRCLHRVLIWNSVPTEDNAPADVVVGQTSFEARTSNQPNRTIGMNQPWDVHSDGTRLAVADSENNRVLIYNTFPTENAPFHDVCLGATNCSNAGSVGANATSTDRPRGVLFANGKLLVSSWDDHRVMVWNDATTLTNNQAADVIIGQTSTSGSGASNANNRLRNPVGMTYDSVNDKLYIADSENCRIQTYNGIPTVTGAAADYAIGHSNSNTSRVCGQAANRFDRIRDIAIDLSDDIVFAASHQADGLYGVSPIPTAPGLSINFRIGTDNLARGVSNYGSEDLDGTKGRFVGVGHDPTTGQFFASDENCDRVMVWNTVPTSVNQEPDFVLGQPDHSTCNNGGRSATRFNNPRGMCVADNKLWISDRSNNRLMVYNLPINSNQQAADGVLGQDTFTQNTDRGSHYIDGPNNCFYDPTNDIFTVTSEDDDVVLVYNGIPNFAGAITENQADYILGVHQSAGRTQQRMNNPRGVAVHGTDIYVGDENNRRVLRFPIPTSDSPNATAVIGQTNYTNNAAESGNGGIRRPRALMVENGRLYVGDYDFRRLIYFDLPISNEFYQTAAGVYGKSGDFDFNEPYGSTELQEHYFYDAVSDGKRFFGVDYVGGRIVITPLREN